MSSLFEVRLAERKEFFKLGLLDQEHFAHLVIKDDCGAIYPLFVIEDCIFEQGVNAEAPSLCILIEERHITTGAFLLPGGSRHKIMSYDIIFSDDKLKLKLQIAVSLYILYAISYEMYVTPPSSSSSAKAKENMEIATTSNRATMFLIIFFIMIKPSF